MSFFCLMALLDLIGLLWVRYWHLGNNMPLIHLVGMVEIVCISLFYFKFINEINLKRIVIIVALMVLLFAIIEGIVIEGIFNYPSIALAPGGIMIILWSLLGFYELLKLNNNIPIYKEPMFWINSGILIYFAGTFFLFLLNDYFMKNDPHSASIFNNINLFLNVLVNIIYSIGVYKKGNEIKIVPIPISKKKF